MPSRVWILPISAVIIIGLCIYKWSQRGDRALDATVPMESKCAAQSFKFELPDQNNKPVRLERYLGRHQIVLVFFDGQRGVEQDDVLVELRRRYSEIEAGGMIVIGVSTALPQHNRPAAHAVNSRQPSIHPQKPFPFELLSDVSQGCDIHRIWGRYNVSKQQATTGTFLIDRAGRVSCEGAIPKPLADPLKTIDELLGG